MKKRVYTAGQLKKYIQESVNEFTPKLGDNVESDNKKNNKEAINTIKKEVDEYNGGITNEVYVDKIGDNMDYNKTTLDLDFDDEPSKAYKERVKSQVKGFPSVENEEMHKEDDTDFLNYNGNDKLYNNLKDRNKTVNKRREEIKKAGLKSREMPDDQFKVDSVFENKSNKIKMLNFKRTKFLSESHMFSRIPEDYKKDKNRFIMMDCDGNKYLIEWVVDEKYNVEKPIILKHENKEKLNEEFNKIKKLINYKHSDFFENSNAKTRLNEDKVFMDFVKKKDNK